MKALGMLVVVTAVVAACGGQSAFRLSSDENNSYELGRSLQSRQLPPQPSPINSAGQPRLFALTAGAGPNKTIVAYDLASGNTLWKVDAPVGSRIAVGGDFIAALEGSEVVGRDQGRGQPKWRISAAGFVGVAADRERVYVVTGGNGKWWISGHDGASGKELWKHDASGALGAPVAQGGLVFVPFLRQWLSIVDGRTGKQRTRLRGIDQDITMVRATSRAAYYGSKQGMFELDARSASGKRTDATFGTVKIPPQLDGATYAPEVYDPVQAQYTAAERKRVLWTSVPVETGPMKLGGDGYAVHYFRYVFGFGTDGGMRWAYSHPRVELVASEHTGNAIAVVSSAGDVVALDPQTGAVRSRGTLGTTSPVLGATFDADGWAPTGQVSDGESTVAALVSIARDRDARFDRVKELAVGALAKLPGPEVTRELLAVLSDNRAPQKLKDAVVDLLVERKDPSSLPVLTQQLAVHSDYLAQTEPDALGPVAKAIAGLGGMTLDKTQVTEALAALQSHLEAPATSVPDLIGVVRAMAAIGGGAERPALISHLLLYRADDEIGNDATWAKAVVVSIAKAGAPERELMRQVAADPRTRPPVAEAIRDLIGPE